jgi:hypothetical protein
VAAPNEHDVFQVRRRIEPVTAVGLDALQAR